MLSRALTACRLPQAPPPPGLCRRYVVPPAHRARFEQLMRSLLPDLFRACPEFMRHKVGGAGAACCVLHILRLLWHVQCSK